MLVTPQKVKVKWNPKNKKYYESILDENKNQKYKWSKSGNEFEVDIEDLPHGSTTKVKIICEYCKEPFEKSYGNLLREREQNSIKKDCCRKCSPLKVREFYGTLDELEYSNQNENLPELKEYTREKLINEFYRYKEEFGIYPKKSDIEALSNYPSANTYDRNWGTWTNFLKCLNIISDDGWYKEDEEVIKNLYAFSSRLKDINDKLMEKRTINDINKKAKQFGYLIKDFIVKREYSYSNKEEKLTISIDALSDLFLDLGKYPTASEYDSYARFNKLYNRKYLEEKFNKRFSEICNSELGGSNKDTKTKEELLDELAKLKNTLGRTPKANELKTNGLSEKKAYMRKFNMTYQELIDSLGWEQASPRLRFKTEEEMLVDYEKLFKEIGRLPNHTDLQNCGYTSSSQTYTEKFGSLKNVWDTLELPYEEMQDISAGYVGINKNNEICRSNAELEISTILIDNNITYTPESKYSDFDLNLNSKWKMDWFLNNYNIYVEYFGMYSETQLKRSTRIGKYSRKVKKKINYCLNNNIILIDLYKKDLENNYEGLIDKFNKVGISLVV